MKQKELAKSTKEEKYCYCKGVASTPSDVLSSYNATPSKRESKTTEMLPRFLEKELFMSDFEVTIEGIG